MGSKCVCVCVCVRVCVCVDLFVCCKSEYQMLKVTVGHVAMVGKQQTNEPAIPRYLPTQLTLLLQLVR